MLPLLNKLNPLNKKQIGDQYEAAAKHYLIAQNVRCLQQNFNCKTGEIDLICRHHDTLVFVEVRFRKNTNYGSAAATISPSKQKKVKSAAYVYLKQQNLNINHVAIRFDAVVFNGSTDNPNWIKNAF